MSVLTEPPITNSIAPFIPPITSHNNKNKPDFSGTSNNSNVPGGALRHGWDNNRFHKRSYQTLGKVCILHPRLPRNQPLTIVLESVTTYGIDPNTILATSHGRRSIDVLKQIDPARATWDCEINETQLEMQTNEILDIQQIEGEIPLLFGDDAVEIKGSRALLTNLDEANVPWAVVTSGTLPLVQGWLKILGLAEPRRLVTAEDVENGNQILLAIYWAGRDLDSRRPRGRWLWKMLQQVSAQGRWQGLMFLRWLRRME